MQRHLRFEIGVTQALLDARQSPDFGFVLDRMDQRTPALMLLGVVERVIGALEQRFRG
jgi:hypothetical protein